jgi:hypothetical protein
MSGNDLSEIVAEIYAISNDNKFIYPTIIFIL